MKASEKQALRAKHALKRIVEPVILDRGKLKEQINNLSTLTRVTNEGIGDTLIGTMQVLEIFEWLPKGKYKIDIEII